MFDVPCSRIAHVYRGSSPFPNDRVGTDFLAINYKRVAEVWMDEYKHYLYQRNPARYNKTDPGEFGKTPYELRFEFQSLVGDLSYQFYIKKRQECKPFRFFFDVVAPGKVSSWLDGNIFN